LYFKGLNTKDHFHVNKRGLGISSKNLKQDEYRGETRVASVKPITTVRCCILVVLLVLLILLIHLQNFIVISNHYYSFCNVLYKPTRYFCHVLSSVLCLTSVLQTVSCEWLNYAKYASVSGKRNVAQNERQFTIRPFKTTKISPAPIYTLLRTCS
jgi:hypothetical protein